MEFVGRVLKLLPQRSGTSQRTGNEWKSLPFVFEYFENDTDRWADSVVLETFDAKVIDNIKEGMEVRCGFGHKVREFTRQDGTTAVINELRLYKIECVKLPTEETTSPASTPPPFEPTSQTNTQQEDDLPF